MTNKNTPSSEEMRRMAVKVLAADDDHMIASNKDLLHWMVAQLLMPDDRVHDDRTANGRFIRNSVAATLLAHDNPLPDDVLDIEKLSDRLFVCANQSELGMNFADTPQACREAIHLIQCFSLFMRKVGHISTMSEDDVDALVQVVLSEAREKGADSPVDYADAEQIVRALLKEFPLRLKFGSIELNPDDKLEALENRAFMAYNNQDTPVEVRATVQDLWKKICDLEKQVKGTSVD